MSATTSLALIAPMLTGKSTMHGKTTAHGRIIVDSDTLVDHTSLVTHFGEPKPDWSPVHWERWNSVRTAMLQVAVADLATHTSTAILLLIHGPDFSAGLTIVGVVLIPQVIFAMRAALHPERAALARLNRANAHQDAVTLSVPVFLSISHAAGLL
jgi:hypothetical protein